MRSVMIGINHRCPLKCGHCAHAYGRQGKARRPDVLREIIRSIDTEIYMLAVLSGGEPSLNSELIAVSIEECSKAGLTSAIVSAPIWARSEKSAERFLNKVAGLDVLILSYDQFHLEFLTFDHYRNAATKAFEKGVMVGFELAYVNEQDRLRHLESLETIRQYITMIDAMRIVSVGSAAHLENAERETILIESGGDLDRIPRGCVLGNVGVDNKLGLHGCCWSYNAEDSPFSLVHKDGESLGERFRKLESSTLFQSVRQNGFLDSLSPLGRRYLALAVKGRRFPSECDICLSTMKKGYEHIWAECVAGPRRGKRKPHSRLNDKGSKHERC